MKFDFEKNKKLIIAALVILFILFSLIRAMIAGLTSNNEENNEETANNTTVNESKDTEKSNRIKKLKKAKEEERIRIYLGEYFKYLENKDYESAYQLLYADFKQNYFPTLAKFKEYIEKCNYPDLLSIDYKSVETVGYYYIITLDINNLDPDAIISESKVKEDTKFVLKEDNYDEFYLSFQL